MNNAKGKPRGLQGGETATIRAISDYLFNIKSICDYRQISKNRRSKKKNNIDFLCSFYIGNKKTEAAIIVKPEDREQLKNQREKIENLREEFECVIWASSVIDVMNYLESKGVMDVYKPKEIKRTSKTKKEREAINSNKKVLCWRNNEAEGKKNKQ